MIASITGKIQSKHSDSLILDVQGLGFEVTVTKSVLAEAEAGDIVFLQYLVVREEMLALYGFRTLEEKQFFLLFLGAEGVGPPPGDGNPFHAFAGQYSHRGGERTAGIFQPCAGNRQEDRAENPDPHARTDKRGSRL